MFKTSVKTSTPAQGMMQILCLTVFWLFTSAWPLTAQAQAQVLAQAQALILTTILTVVHKHLTIIITVHQQVHQLIQITILTVVQ